MQADHFELIIIMARRGWGRKRIENWVKAELHVQHILLLTRWRRRILSSALLDHLVSVSQRLEFEHPCLWLSLSQPHPPKVCKHAFRKSASNPIFFSEFAFYVFYSCFCAEHQVPHFDFICCLLSVKMQCHVGQTNRPWLVHFVILENQDVHQDQRQLFWGNEQDITWGTAGQRDFLAAERKWWTRFNGRCMGERISQYHLYLYEYLI